MDPAHMKSVPLSPQTHHISVLAGKSTPLRNGPSSISPPTHYTGSTNYTDTEWREVQAWGNVKETQEVRKTFDEMGRKIINKYEVIREIGRGVHGKVKLARTMDSNEMVALKILPRKTRARLGKPETNTHEQTVKREIAILKKCVHPHVVRLREAIDDPASDKIYLVLEYMWGGEVIWRNDKDEPVLKLHQARSTFRDTLLGLEFLHYQGIVHRDIKPANLLWTKNHSVKISDFGVSHTSAESEGPSTAFDLAKTAGTPAFFAPELCWTTEVERPPITKAIDVWALGVTLYCLLCGKVPFAAYNEFELFDKIVNEEIQIPDHLDDESRDLLSRMLVKDPSKRITIAQIKRHPFVLKGVKDPDQWISDTNPGLFGVLEVNEQELHEAVSSYENLKRRLTKLGSRLAGGLRRRTISSEVPKQTTKKKSTYGSEGSSRSGSWMNFMRTNDSAETKEKETYLDRIKSEEHVGARPIIMRRPSPREADNLTRSHSPIFNKQLPSKPNLEDISHTIFSIASDPPQTNLTRSRGYPEGLLAEAMKEDVGSPSSTSQSPRLPALDFETGSDNDDSDDDGCFIDLTKRRASGAGSHAMLSP